MGSSDTTDGPCGSLTKDLRLARQTQFPRRAIRIAVLACALLLVGVMPQASETAAGEVGSIEPILTGLEWPVAIAFAPDGRLLYAELLTGRIRVVSNGELLPTPFVTFDDAVFGGERGLLGLALDPDFATDPWVYAYYTYFDAVDGRDYNRIVRVLADGDVGTAREVVMEKIPGAGNHNGGVIAFGPDGMLYALVGDAADPANAQNLTSRAGKVLRMTPAGGIPEDNPFVGNASADPYVLTYGHRNLFGLAFHPATGRAYATENGPFCNDEVNLLTPGGNYGWGPNWTCDTPPDPPLNTNQDGPDPVLPLFWYGRVVAPTNAIVYRGEEFPEWDGDLLVGEWNTGILRRIDLGGPDYDTVLASEIAFTAPSRILDVEIAPDDSIWFTSSEAIFRYRNAVPPVAVLSMSTTTPVANETVEFDASGSYDPDGAIVSYAWDFGDGGSATGPTVTHAYAVAGAYSLQLTVTDDDGLTAQWARIVEVRERIPPVGLFTVSSARPLVGEVVTFDASGSSADGTIVSYDWAFGDGTEGSGVLTTHAYGRHGAYTVTLTVRDARGDSGRATQGLQVLAPPAAGFEVSPANPIARDTVTFAASGSFDPDGYVASYEWDFGDGTSGSGFVAEHVYNLRGSYEVVLTVTDNDGHATTTSAFVEVNDRPSAVLRMDAMITYIGVPVSFNASLSSDQDGSLVSYRWDFGDGSSAAGVTVTHAYLTRGTFTVRLTVVDNLGASALATAWIEIANRGPEIVSYLPSVESLRLPVGQAHVLSVVATDPDGDSLSYEWTVDGRRLASGTSTIRFWQDAPGSFRVRVDVSDGDLVSSYEWTIVVEESGVQPRSAGVPDWTWILVGGLAVVGGGVLFVAYRGKSRARGR